MKVGFPGGPRLEWYDRNPQPIEQMYVGADIAPHGALARFSYTVPTGKKFFLESVMCLLMRITAATTAGRVKAYIMARDYHVVDSQTFTNNVGDRDKMNVGRSVIMQAGELLVGKTSDTSEAGTVDYRLDALGIEFDA